jgi:hypothetical protein
MRNRKSGSAVLLALVAAASVHPAAEAGEVIFSYVGGSGTFQGGLVAGSSFNAPNGATFNSLGFIDVGSDGLADSYQVGLWDTNTQALLASTTVTPASPLINGFRYAAIPQTILAPGTSFTVGALLHTTQPDAWVTSASIADGAGFTGAGIGRFFGSNITLTFPSSPDGVTYVVANASDAIVPAPATLGLAGVGGLLLRRRSRRA